MNVINSYPYTYINVGLKFVQPVSLLLFKIFPNCFHILKQLLGVNIGLF